MSANVSFFVDSNLKSSSHDGKSAETAFRDFEILNSMTLSPGDCIYLKSGSVFTDHLIINGSGEEGAPITVAPYGQDNAKPIIATADGSAFCVLVKGEYVTVCGLELTNPSGTNALLVKSEKQGAVRGVIVKDCYIHDVWIENDLGPRHLRPKSWPHEAGGISIETNREAPTWYEGLCIEHNTIERVNRTGIWLGGQWNNRFKNTLRWMANPADGMDDPWYPHRDIYIGYNLVDHAHGDGIVGVGCVNLLMEYNRVYYANCMSRNGNSNVALWTMNCTGALVQYNEVAFTCREYGGDGEAFDIDQCNIDNIYQYNYSHDNTGGFFLVCNGCSAKDSLYHNIVRNNLSVNDATGRDDALLNFSGPMRDIKFLNNTVYTARSNRFRLLQIADYPQIGLPQDLYFINNAFVSEQSNNWNNIEAAGKLFFYNNVCWNITRLPQRENIVDQNYYTVLPVFQEECIPATRSHAKGFSPMWNSPLLRLGVPDCDAADRDFFGNDTEGKIYIGAICTRDMNI